MPKDSKSGTTDRKRIDPHEEYEVADWAFRLDVSRERLLATIDRVGPMADDVRRELSR
jgi:hypothetical protein